MDIPTLIVVMNFMQSAGFTAAEIATWFVRTFKGTTFISMMQKHPKATMGDTVLIAMCDIVPMLLKVSN
jgi:hypothetical protein